MDVRTVDTPKTLKTTSKIKLSGNITLSTYSPALLSFIRARLDAGATNREIEHEFGVSHGTVTAIRKSSIFNKSHVEALKSGLSNAFATVAASALSSINPDKLANCSAPQLMMVAGVAYDKLRLAQGESTANISFRDAGSQAINVSRAADDMLSGLASEIGLTALPEPKE